MDSAGWQNIFRSFRPEDQEQLIIVMNGFDVAVQSIARIEEDMVLVRGRYGGTADNGRLFLLPFSGISGIFVNRFVIPEEVPLFAPSVSKEEKEKVAREVARMAEKAKDDIEKAKQEANADKGKGGTQNVSDDLKKQLEALREAAGFASNEPKPQPGRPAPGAARPTATPGARPAVPGVPGAPGAPAAKPAAPGGLPQAPTLPGAATNLPPRISIPRGPGGGPRPGGPQQGGGG